MADLDVRTIEDLVPPDVSAALVEHGYTVVRTSALELLHSDVEQRAAINRGVATMHVRAPDGECVECRREWPCRSSRLTDGEIQA